MTREPEIVIEFLQLLSTYLREAVPEDFLAGAIEKKNSSGEIRGDQTTTHGVNDVFGEVL